MQANPNPDDLAASQRPDVRALVVAEDPLVGDGLVARLHPAAAGRAAPTDDLEVAVAELGANSILWDLGPQPLPSEVTGFEDLGIPVVALGPPQTMAAPILARGARGVLLRDASGPTLRSALHSALHGLNVIDPSLLLQQAADPEPAGANQPTGDVQLTTRESEVLQWMAAGLSNKRIAAKLGISTHTAKFHIGAILAKLDADTRTEAVVKAFQLGLVML